MSNYFDNKEAPHSSGLNPNCPIPEIGSNDDGQVLITGRIATSGNTPYPGWVEVEAQSTLTHYGRSPRTITTRRPHRFTIGVDGLVSFPLINSQDTGTVYKFSVGYTQVVVVEGSPINRDIITDSWYAQVPRPKAKGVQIDLSSLLPTGISDTRLDTSLGRLAELIVSDDVLRERALGVLTFAGVFDPAKRYRYREIVTVPGTLITDPYRSYVCSDPRGSTPGTFSEALGFMRLT
jgi:hypothetical protein